jgi:hypothetical protein
VDVALMGKKRDLYRVLEGKPEQERTLSKQHFLSSNTIEVPRCVCVVAVRIKVFTDLVKTEETNCFMVQSSLSK